MTEESTNPLESFPDEVQEDIEGLIWLGYLEDEVHLGGHSWVIRTLRGDEELLAALITKDYMDTMAQARALTWAQVSLAIAAVDGDEDFCPPVGPDKREYARARFQYCSSKWYYPVAQFLYGHYTGLLERQVAAINAIADLSAGSLTTSTPSVDSLTERGGLDRPEAPPSAEPEEDITEYLKGD